MKPLGMGFIPKLPVPNNLFIIHSMTFFPKHLIKHPLSVPHELVFKIYNKRGIWPMIKLGPHI